MNDDQTQPAQPANAIAERRAGTVATSANPAELLRIAVQSGASLESLERLMALQERWETNEARKKFIAAMAAFKAEPMTIYKRKKVDYATKGPDGKVNGRVQYSHAELSDVTEVVVPNMAKHGLSHKWNVTQSGKLITVSCIITHAAGYSDDPVTMHGEPDTSGKKNPLQQVQSAVSYLQRHTLLAATGMSTKGMDDDGRKAFKPEAADDDGDDPGQGRGQGREREERERPGLSDEDIKAWREASAKGFLASRALFKSWDPAKRDLATEAQKVEMQELALRADDLKRTSSTTIDNATGEILKAADQSTDQWAADFARGLKS